MACWHWAVAIELGRKYSCIGYSSKYDAASTKAIPYEVGNISTTKVPTSILLTPTKKFHSFGYAAEKQYKELKKDGAADDWWMFQEFTQLHEIEKSPNDITVHDVRGRPMSAVRILGMGIRYSLDMFQDFVTRFPVGLRMSDCVVVIVVPGTWTQSARTCMKYAAERAGIPENRIRLIHASEAASIMCQYELSGRKTINPLVTSDTLAVNWENDRVDIAYIEPVFGGSVKVTQIESQQTENADPLVNAFISWIAQICGDSFELIAEHFDSDAKQAIQLRVRAVRNGLGGKTTISLPTDIYKACTSKSKGTEKIQFVSGKVRIDNDIVRNWFYPQVQNTVDFIKALMFKKRLQNVQNIILFGEFAENKFIVDLMEKNFHQKLVVPEDVSVALVRGACIYGHHPESVASRIIQSSENPPTKQIEVKPILVVAAFDFGTTYSGYAYSFKNSPLDIWTNKRWNSGNHLSLKAPTCVLLTPKKQFDSFGYDAETKFANLCEDDKHHGWMLFRRFKMVLHTKKELSRQMMIEDINGNKMLAITIFTMAIEYLRKELVKTINDSKVGVDETDILYVLTVPAIWNDAAKQFMKEAAVQAGIDKDRIQFALEPEAASIWCQHIQADVRERLSKPGTQFMVVDLGGGTVDVSVQEKQAGGKLKEIHRASGGPWGGTVVDENFFAWLSKTFGEAVMTRLRREQLSDYFDLYREMEIKKRAITPEKTNNFITIKDSGQLGICHKEMFGTDIGLVVENLGLSEKVKYKNGKLRIEPSIVKSWFVEPIQYIVRHVKSILNKPHMEKIQIVMLVGGFAECLLLQDAFRSDGCIGKKFLIIPEEAGIAVLKGAVEFGLNPTVISKRIMRYTYGIAKRVVFDKQMHNPPKVIDKDGQQFVDIFEQFVKADSEIEIGEVITKGVVPTSNKSTNLKIYSSAETNPQYITDATCKQIGEMLIEHPEGRTMQDKIFSVKFEFGKTEINVTVVKEASGDEISTQIDCL